MNLYHIIDWSPYTSEGAIAFMVGGKLISLPSCNRLCDISDDIYKPLHLLNFTDIGPISSHIKKRKPLRSDRLILPWDRLINYKEEKEFITWEKLIAKFRGVLVHVNRNNPIVPRGRYLIFTYNSYLLVAYNIDSGKTTHLGITDLGNSRISILKSSHSYSLSQVLKKRSIKLFDSLILSSVPNEVTG